MENKGQIKIQQMAFVLVAVFIFFSMAAVFYLSISSSNLRENVESLREQEVLEQVRAISSTAEFNWEVSGDCAACLDFDKALMLKERESYQDFWKDIQLLEIRKIYPKEETEIECSLTNYPNCNKLTLVEKQGDFRAHGAFVSLCRYDQEKSSNICELGQVLISTEVLE